MRGLLIAIAIIIVAIIAIAIWNSSQNSSANQQQSSNTYSQNQTTTTAPSGSSNSSMTVNLSAENNSGESGSATVSDQNGKTMVVLNLSGATSTVSQPAHFHSGTCQVPGAIIYPLNPVVRGKSSTTLNVSYQDFLAKLPMIVNVHKSASQSNVYVSCGTAE